MSAPAPTLERPSPPEPRHLRNRLLVVALVVTVVLFGLVMLGLWLLLGDDAGANDPAVTDPGVPVVEAPEGVEGEPGIGGLPAPAAGMAERIEQAATAGDWDRLAELALDGGTPFTASFGEELATVDELAAYWRGLATEEDLARIVPAMIGLPDWAETGAGDADGAPVTIHVTPGFMHEPTAANRDQLEAAMSPEWLEVQLPDGQYLGWQLGITADGDWQFLVQGD